MARVLDNQNMYGRRSSNSLIWNLSRSVFLDRLFMKLIRSVDAAIHKLEVR